MTSTLKDGMDGIALTAGIGFILEALPLIIGLLTVIWAVYRVYDLHLAIKLKKKQLKEQPYGHEREL